MLSNIFTQLENGLRYKHLAAGRKAHMLGCTPCHTPMLTCTCSLALTCLRFSPVHMPTSLHAHTDLLPTWKLQGKLSLLIQILSTHIVTQAKQGPNSTSIQGTVQGNTAHHLLVQLSKAEVSVPADTHAASLHASFELDELLRELACFTYISSNSAQTTSVIHTCQHASRHSFPHIRTPTYTLL